MPKISEAHSPSPMLGSESGLVLKTARPDPEDGVIQPRPSHESGFVVMSQPEIQSLERRLSALQTELSKLHDHSDRLDKTAIAVGKTCERILDRVEAMDSQLHLSEKRILGLETDFKEHVREFHGLLERLQENSKGINRTIVKAGGGGALILLIDFIVNLLTK